MSLTTIQRRAGDAGKTFLVRVNVGRVANPAEEHVVVCRVKGVNNASEAIDMFCDLNTSYLMHSSDYFLVDYYTEETT